MANAELALYERNSLALWKPAWGGKLFQWVDSLVSDDVVAAIDEISKHDALLNARAGSSYSPEQVSEALEDEAFLISMDRAVQAGELLASAWPVLRSVPLWMFFPKRRLLLNKEFRDRTQRTLRALNEAMTGLQRLLTKQQVAAFHRTKALAFMEDPDVPTEVAKRLLAGIRGRITLDLCLTQKARRWSLTDTKRALLDWMDATEYSLRFLASVPGISVPSLPRERLFDLEAVVQKHQARRARLAGEAMRAFGELS